MPVPWRSEDRRGRGGDPIAGSAVYPAGSRVNERGHLEVGGCDVVELADRVRHARLRLRRGRHARPRPRLPRGLRAPRTDDFEVLFASKALPCTAAYRLFAEEGLSVDVASGGELHMALRAGFDPERIHMHGNNKTEAELRFAARRRRRPPDPRLLRRDRALRAAARPPAARS